MEFRIEFTIQRKKPGDDDFTEVGFGSSTAEGSIEAALYSADSIIQNRQWETTSGMPEPEEVDR